MLGKTFLTPKLVSSGVIIPGVLKKALVKSATKVETFGDGLVTWFRVENPNLKMGSPPFQETSILEMLQCLEMLGKCEELGNVGNRRC